jgi:hypothetical protein
MLLQQIDLSLRQPDLLTAVVQQIILVLVEQVAAAVDMVRL